MAITAALVKELRERTGAGMMECKKALVETEGDIEAAKTSNDGKQAAIVEVNCETDFVAKGDDFKNFVDAVAQRVLDNQPADVEALLAMALSDDDATSIEDVRKTMVAKLGENMSVRRFELINGQGNLASYMHGARIGVVVDVAGGDETLGKDIAMHIAASRPVCVSENEVPQEDIEKEKEIFSAQAAESGKPADIIEKMVSGRIKKFLKEVTLLGQPFVKDPDQTVEQLLKGAGATVNSFVRFEVGEGIEKKQENFADEVMAQVKG